MKKDSYSLSDIIDLINRVNENKTGIFSRIPELIAILEPNLAKVIGDDHIHISEFIIAKVKGMIPALDGHLEITDHIFKELPININNPKEILVDKRVVGKYLFIARNPVHVIVMEVMREESGKTEINTIYPIGEKERRRLDKYPIAFSSISGGTPTPSCMPRH
jgi:hypothetical protein